MRGLRLLLVVAICSLLFSASSVALAAVDDRSAVSVLEKPGDGDKDKDKDDKEKKADKKDGKNTTFYWRYSDGHVDHYTGWSGGVDVFKDDVDPPLHVNMLHVSCSDTVYADGTVRKGDLAGHHVAEWWIDRDGRLCSGGTTTAAPESAGPAEEDKDRQIRRDRENEAVAGSQTRTEVVCVDNELMTLTFRDERLVGQDSTGVSCGAVAGVQTAPITALPSTSSLPPGIPAGAIALLSLGGALLASHRRRDI